MVDQPDSIADCQRPCQAEWMIQGVHAIARRAVVDTFDELLTCVEDGGIAKLFSNQLYHFVHAVIVLHCG